jgi:hypothetical protein
LFEVKWFGDGRAVVVMWLWSCGCGHEVVVIRSWSCGSWNVGHVACRGDNTRNIKWLMWSKDVRPYPGDYFVILHVGEATRETSNSWCDPNMFDPIWGTILSCCMSRRQHAKHQMPDVIQICLTLSGGLFCHFACRGDNTWNIKCLMWSKYVRPYLGDYFVMLHVEETKRET